MTDKKIENTNDKVGEVTSFNQLMKKTDASISNQYLEKKYTEKEIQIGCQHFFHIWNPPTIQNPSTNVKRLFEHMEKLNWDNDDIHMDLMEYLFGNRKLIKKVMFDIDEMEEEIIKNNPKFNEDENEDDIYDLLWNEWNDHWQSSLSIADSPLIPLCVNFIRDFYQTLYNEYIQFLINGENVTDEYVSGFNEDILKQMEEENNKAKEESKESVKVTVKMVA
jgi:hypothetical protein